MPLLAKHPVALFKYIILCGVKVCEKHRKCMRVICICEMRKQADFLNSNTLKDKGMQVGKFVVIAHFFLFYFKQRTLYLDL